MIKESIRKNWEIIIIMIIAVISRGVGLGICPMGIDADEAYAGYEAWSLLKYGHDSWGYTNPVYLTTWGSGMSVLYSVLSIPFIAIGGLNTVTFRIPQFLFGSLTVFVFYLLLKKVSSESIALWGSFLLAISPWHIILSRYGLDANLAPAFLLLGIYFCVLGIEKQRYLPFAAIMLGLSLYCYALLWLFVPIFFGTGFLYCIKHKKVKVLEKGTLSFFIILFLMALPLLLFVATNLGFIPEIKSSIISIPKLVEFRGDELSIKSIIQNIYVLCRILIKQDDYTIRNSIPYFGICYLFSLPFIIIGGIAVIKRIINNRKKFDYGVLLLLWIFISLAIGSLRTMNIQRINYLHLATYILLAIGIERVISKFGKSLKRIIFVTYMIGFLLFETYYFSEYQENIGEAQLAGAEQALEYSLAMFEENGYDEIVITSQLRHPQVLFYTQYPTDAFMKEVTWKNYPAGWLIADSFGSFSWNDKEELQENSIYIILAGDAESYEAAGWNVEKFDSCAVALK